MRIPALVGFVRRLSAAGGTTLPDALVAVLLLAAALAALAVLPRDPSPVVGVVACAVQAGAVAWRGRWPTLAPAAALTGMVLYESATHDPSLAAPPVAVILTCYTFGRHGAPRCHPLRVVTLAGMGLAATSVVSAQLHEAAATAVSSWLATVVAPFLVGVVLAQRSRVSQRLADAATQLRAEQALNLSQATAAERNRVARDLHDVVAHCVSVMVVQAGAARLVAARSSADADRALEVIGDCGRAAMVDLRRIVGVLRRDDDPDFGLGVGLADLGGLVERIQAAGVSAHLRIDGRASLPPAVDVVVYRIAQEALTNVVKHAGPGATANVDVCLTPDAVTVEVVNTSTGTRRPFAASGHGAAGMRERVSAYGGELLVGPRPDGGYGVRAQIPVHPVALRPAAAEPEATHRPALPAISQRVANALVVSFWLVVLEVEVATSSAVRGSSLVNAAAVAAMALAAVWRRRYPLLFLVVVGGLAAVLSAGLTSLDRSTIAGLYSLVLPLFAVAAWENRSRAVVGLALWTAGATGLAILHSAAAGGLAGAVVMGVVVWATGRVWRTQLLLHHDLSETTARLAAERDQRAELAVTTERTRIARDLHGPVAHGVTTMVVQAEAARQLLVHQPEQVEAAIRDIERTGREALTQLRRILGVLRSTTTSPAAVIGAGTPPAPGADERSTWLAEAVLT